PRMAPAHKGTTEALGGWDDEPAPPKRSEWERTRPLDGDAEPAPARPQAQFAETDLPEDPAHQPLRAAAEEFGGSLEELADGSLVVTLKGSGAATDQAARAARCALALRTHLPGAPMALATGRGMVALRFPVGEAIDHAARLLREVMEDERAGTR